MSPSLSNASRREVIGGLNLHSPWWDVYYTAILHCKARAFGTFQTNLEGRRRTAGADVRCPFFLLCKGVGKETQERPRNFCSGRCIKKMIRGKREDYSVPHPFGTHTHLGQPPLFCDFLRYKLFKCKSVLMIIFSCMSVTYQTFFLSIA